MPLSNNTNHDGCFVVVAIPSSDYATTTDEDGISIEMEMFRSTISRIIEESNNSSDDDSNGIHMTIHDITRVIDPSSNDADADDAVTHTASNEDGEDSVGIDYFLISLELKRKTTKTQVNDDFDDEDDNVNVNLNDFDVTKLLKNPNAEIWVNSTVPLPLAPPYGWTRDTFYYENSDDSDADQTPSTMKSTTTNRTMEIVKCLKEYGLVFIKGSSSPAPASPPSPSATTNHTTNFYDVILRKLDDRIQELEFLIQQNHPHITLGETPFGFEEYTYRGVNRFELLFNKKKNTSKAKAAAQEDGRIDATSDDETDDTNNEDEIYNMLREYYEPQFENIVKAYLGATDIRKELRLNISCVYSKPGSQDQEWHTDGNVSGSNYSDNVVTVENDTIDDPNNTKPYAICIFVPLIQLTQDIGYTRFWPKSHLQTTKLLGLGIAADKCCLQATIDGILPNLGDYIIYDYTSTWHKGVGWYPKKNEGRTSRTLTTAPIEEMRKASSDATTASATESEEQGREVEPKIRPVVQFLYSYNWYKERKNYGTKSIYD